MKSTSHPVRRKFRCWKRRQSLKSLSESGNELMGGVVITVVEEPRIFETPINARPGKIAIAVGILAFFAICTLLSWRSSARYTVRNSMEVAPKLETELLAVIPKERKLFNNKSEILITDPSVSGRIFRGSAQPCNPLDERNGEKGEKTLLVFGALEDEGKSTSAANIALALSQMNRKVVLADMDFSKPSLAKILNMKDAQLRTLHSTWCKRCFSGSYFSSCQNTRNRAGAHFVH